MAFAFTTGERVGDGIRRIAAEEKDEAVRALDAAEPETMAETVHDVRKRCKRLRAVARIVRPCIGDSYGPTNEAFRDAAREVSASRDRQVLVETIEHLVAAAPSTFDVDLSPALDALQARHHESVDALVQDPSPLQRARSLLEAGWRQVETWELADDFATLAGGLAKTYGRAVDRHERCRDEPTTERLHEWRKRVKYHRHHVELLRPLDPALVEPWADRLNDLSDLLGDDHDLAVLLDEVRSDPDAYGGAAVVDGIRVLVLGRRNDLQRRALALGARVTAEDPDAVVDRLGLWWEAWRTHGPAPTRTELTDFPPA